MVPWYSLIPLVVLCFYLGFRFGVWCVVQGTKEFAKENAEAAEALRLLQKAAHEARD